MKMFQGSIQILKMKELLQLIPTMKMVSDMILSSAKVKVIVFKEREKLFFFFTDLDDIKEFAKSFKLRRLSMGLTQTQVGQALNIAEGPAYSQSAICR